MSRTWGMQTHRGAVMAHGELVNADGDFPTSAVIPIVTADDPVAAELRPAMPLAFVVRMRDVDSCARVTIGPDGTMNLVTSRATSGRVHMSSVSYPLHSATLTL